MIVVLTWGVVTMNEKWEGRLVPFGRLHAVAGLLSLILAYCVIVMILRYVFDIEIWNPF
jgi:hypothetical protein